ncbi:MAG: hypothetical protein RL377_1207, partial [Bacteroidota bacterium]
MKKTLTLLGILLTHFVFAQNKDVNAIKSILENQTASWNKGDLNS